MSDSGASSQTLSTQSLDSGNEPTYVPYELVDLILSHSIAEVIHESAETALEGQSITQSLYSSWHALGTLAGVSATFRAIVLKLLSLAFRTPLPCESILTEAYSQCRSLLLFKAATLSRAVMDPPVAWSPLMQAYGHYFRAKFLDHALVPRRRKAEVYLAQGLCKTTAEGLSRPLVGALDSHLREVLAAENRE